MLIELRFLNVDLRMLVAVFKGQHNHKSNQSSIK